MKALELADKLEESSWTIEGDPQTERASAAELRRLAEVNAELLEVLATVAGIMKVQRDIFEVGQKAKATWDHPIGMCEKAIDKAKEQQ